MDSLTPGTQAHLDRLSGRRDAIVARVAPTQLHIIAFLAKMQAKAANGEPATVRAWWGGLPPFPPNPDKVQE